MRCEDYPCCGHEPGDCPRIDAKGHERFRCVGGCGRELKVGARSSICDSCLRRDDRRREEYGDHDHSGDY